MKKKEAKRNSTPYAPDPKMEILLWGGFSSIIKSRLQYMKSSSKKKKEIFQSSWALARRCLAEGDAWAAYENITIAKDVSPETANTLPFRMYEVEVLKKLGYIGEAIEKAKGLHDDFGDDPRVCYLKSGLFEDPVERLKWMNKPLLANGFSPLHLQSPDGPLSIHNVAASAVAELDGPKVSVIMPAFNSAATIETAARGILEQTWRNIELIIVDDCSTDDTWKLIEKIAAADSRVVAIRQATNGGAYRSRNAALALASGEYITVNDADDWAHPQRVAAQMKSLRENPGTVNTTYGIRATEDLVGVIKPRSGNSLVVNTASLVFPREVMERLGSWDEVRFAADSELYFRLRQTLKSNEKELYKFVPLTFILSREESLTNSGPTGLSSLHYGARREYKEASAYWRSISHDLKIEPGKRAFPVSRIALERVDEPLEVGLVVVSDFSMHNANNQHALHRALASNGRFALFHLPRLENFGDDIHLAIRKLIHDNEIPVVSAGEHIACDAALVVDPVCLMTLPDRLPAIAAKRCVIYNEAGEEFDPETITGNAAFLSQSVIHLHTIAHTLAVVDQPDMDIPDSWRRLDRKADVSAVAPLAEMIKSRRNHVKKLQPLAQLAVEIEALEAQRDARRKTKRRA